MPALLEVSSETSECTDNSSEDEAPQQSSADDNQKPMADLSDILLFDPENRCYRFRQDTFDEVLAEAAKVIWSDATT